MKRDLPQQDEALFSSAHAALTFALNFSHQQSSKSAMSALLPPEASKGGKGLGGLDGAAQAGMIRAELKACGPVVEALLIARCAPRSTPCVCKSACCSGHRQNDEYEEAITLLCREAMSHLSGMLSHYTLRRALIEQHYGKKVQIKELADLCGVAEKTVQSHKTRIKEWLAGVSRDQQGAEAKAWLSLELKLELKGLI